jgi:haloalkane dehalogenase
MKTGSPNTPKAFAQTTSQLADAIAANTGCLVELRRSAVPSCSSGARTIRACRFPPSSCAHGVLHALEAGHWPQIDAAEQAARIMLA